MFKSAVSAYKATLGVIGATALACVAVVSTVKPANAGTCWFTNGTHLVPNYCQTTRRVNSNGHVVFDVVDHLGDKFTLVFWDNYTAEMINARTGQVTNARTWFDAEGDLRIETSTGEMAIRF